jgi:hypothetical protein
LVGVVRNKMKRTYKDGEKEGIIYFTGIEIERTPAFGMKTLFVVGPQPVKEIINNAEEKQVNHIYLGANHSFKVDLTKNNQNEIKSWSNIIHNLVDKNYWITLDYDVRYYQWVLDCNFNEYEKFISQISVKLPNISKLNNNACIKVDDIGFNSTNSGVWVHKVNKLLDKNNFTSWPEYKNDEPINYGNK